MDRAYEYLTNYADVGERNMKFNINCGDNKRGIYLREKHHLLKPCEVVITVEPVYMDNDSTGLFITLTNTSYLLRNVKLLMIKYFVHILARLK